MNYGLKTVKDARYGVGSKDARRQTRRCQTWDAFKRCQKQKSPLSFVLTDNSLTSPFLFFLTTHPLPLSFCQVYLGTSVIF